MSQQNPGLGEVIGQLLALPFAVISDWFGLIKKQPQGQQELMKACHGAGMLGLLGLWAWRNGGVAEFFASLALNPANPFYWLPIVIAAWGLAWVLLYSRFAAQAIGRPRRGTMILHAALKLGLGLTFWAIARNGDLAARAGDAGVSGIVVVLLYVVAVWCLSTGITKLGLMLWGGSRGQAYPMVADDIAAKEFTWDQDQAEPRPKTSSMPALALAAAIIGLLLLWH